jgi:hypothetical protein
VDYDASRDPSSEAWLAAPEPERLAAVERHHAGLTGHARVRSARLHAAVHATVENQLASGDPPQVRRALARLLAGGLDRHEAVHAIGLIVSDVMAATLDGRRFDAKAYAAELDGLTAERWRGLAGGG